MPVLQVIIASTRPGRVGLPVGEWAVAGARDHGRFTVERVDLAEVGLPFLDEPHHPRLRRYTHPHTKAWSASVDRADAFVFVMPEYNYGFTAPLKNALDFVAHEWHHKPVGFVSYGGVAGGTRAVQLLKPVLSALRLAPVGSAVHIPFVAQFVADGALRPQEQMQDALRTMLDELVAAEEALRGLRAAALAGRP